MRRLEGKSRDVCLNSWYRSISCLFHSWYRSISRRFHTISFLESANPPPHTVVSEWYLSMKSFGWQGTPHRENRSVWLVTFVHKVPGHASVFLGWRLHGSPDIVNDSPFGCCTETSLCSWHNHFSASVPGVEFDYRFVQVEPRNPLQHFLANQRLVQRFP